MRADRLLSLLMILQARGRVTAEALADELEVSLRTIYRDVTALSAWGVPVYTERGPGGGIALIERYRTDLTGLSKDEARALFMLSIPAPLDDLGVGQELKRALLKLAAALPSTRRGDEEESRQRIHLDWTPWFHEQEPRPHLQIIQQALWDDRRMHIQYLTEGGAWIGLQEADISPYGLVAKSGVWYLIAHRHDYFIVVRVAWIQAASLLDEHFERHPDFDLSAYWERWSSQYESEKPHYPVRVRVSAALLAALQRHFGKGIQIAFENASPPDAEGWTTLTLRFESLEDARNNLLKYGSAIEVLEPIALRFSLIDFAEQIRARYAG
ncbi:MAG: WYL domain-containing protein [Anaerolineae bacterium]|nr:WYL domain-containing protein [Anaerolineae bacterium]MBL6965804.1 WYL domain-containing protein [Anaerolineales bacterium]